MEGKFKAGDTVICISHNGFEGEAGSYFEADGIEIGKPYTVSSFTKYSKTHGVGIKVGKVYTYPESSFELYSPEPIFSIF